MTFAIGDEQAGAPLPEIGAALCLHNLRTGPGSFAAGQYPIGSARNWVGGSRVGKRKLVAREKAVLVLARKTPGLRKGEIDNVASESAPVSPTRGWVARTTDLGSSLLCSISTSRGTARTTSGSGTTTRHSTVR